MKVRLIGAADPVAHDGDFAVHHQRHGFEQLERAEVARLAAEVVLDLGQRGEPEAGQTGDLADLDFVHVVVAAQQQQPDPGFEHFAGAAHLVGGQHQGLDGALQRQAQQVSDFGAGALAGGGGFRHGLGRGLTRTGRRQGFGFFHVGCVVAARAVDDGVFAGGGDHLELFAQVAADGAAVGGHGAVAQAEAVKNLAVSRRHHLIAGLGRSLVAVKAVGILHDEFAPAHQTKTRPAFVAELGLDLVKILGQLLVAADVLAHHVGDDFFAGGLHHEVAAMAVLNAQQLGTHLLEAPGFLPELGRLNHRHGHFNGAGAVHFFAHDGLDLANHTQTHGHVVVNAGTQLFDHAGAHHELMADDFGVGRRFLERGNEELGGFHAGVFSRGGGLSPAAGLALGLGLCIMGSV